MKQRHELSDGGRKRDNHGPQVDKNFNEFSACAGFSLSTAKLLVGMYDDDDDNEDNDGGSEILLPSRRGQ